MIYNKTTGALFYNDADGTDSTASAVQFATLGTSSHPLLAFDDFQIIA